MNYSPYYFKNFHTKKYDGNSAHYAGNTTDAYPRKEEHKRENTENTEHKAEKTENFTKKPTAPSVRGAERVEKRDKTVVFVTVIIMISFLCVILCAEILSGGIILKELQSAFNPDLDRSYYFLVQPSSEDKKDAEILSSSVMSMGGAGYVYVQNNQYFVVIATYLDKKSAEAVKKKNSGFDIFEMKILKLQTGAADASLYEKTRTKVKSAIETLYVCGNNLDNHSASESGVYETITKLRNEMLLLKNDVASAKTDAKTKAALLREIAPVFNGLEKILTSEKNDGLASNLRYIAAAAVYTLATAQKI